jgi:hypothetical protein
MLDGIRFLVYAWTNQTETEQVYLNLQLSAFENNIFASPVAVLRSAIYFALNMSDYDRTHRPLIK